MAAIVRLNKQELNDLINSIKESGGDPGELEDLMGEVIEDRARRVRQSEAGTEINPQVEQARSKPCWGVVDVPSSCGHIWHIALREEDYYLTRWVALAMETKQLPTNTTGKCLVCQKTKTALLTRLKLNGFSVYEWDNRLTLLTEGKAIADITIG